MRLRTEHLAQRGVDEVRARVRLRGAPAPVAVDDGGGGVAHSDLAAGDLDLWLMSPLTGFCTSRTSRSKPEPTMRPASASWPPDSA